VAILVLAGTLGAWTLLAFLAAPKAWQVIRVFSTPKPAAKPTGYPLWPLWYVAWAFLVTRQAGVFFVLGLVANAIYPVFLR
jgi:1,4-dihydroxy-2-naphthoate octaprenyltransferase